MTEKEKLYYLIRQFIKGNYTVDDFCDEFTFHYNINVDYSTLSEVENQFFSDLSDMTARFSNFEEDLKIPNLYYDEKQIRSKVMKGIQFLNASK